MLAAGQSYDVSPVGRLTVANVVLFAVVCIAPAATASPAALQFLRTPSGNIRCALTWGDEPTQLRCDILTGVRPLPPKPASCEFDWGAGYRLDRTGRARITCVSDTAAGPGTRVLRYGTTWRRLGFTCTSRRVGLRCQNTVGHGFFLSRAHSFRF
jgi:hypothetical protein